MRLRNKKTGEIAVIRETIHLTKENDICCGMGSYNSLTELNEEWEDVPEEPKGMWAVGEFGELYEVSGLALNKIEELEQIGNYFETEEEAERAVEKLKAWKRLKDKGFRFDGWDENHHNLGIIEFSFSGVEKSVYDFGEDLDLLFGGEDE